MMDEDWDLLVSFFPEDWAELAERSGALKGLRKDKSPPDLLRTLLMHMGCGYSLRETAARVRKAELANLTDVALMKRLRKSEGWLQGLCVALFRERGLAVGSAAGPQFRLFDATTVREPGKTGSLWRIHYSVRVPSLACDHFTITKTQGAGTGESLKRFPVEACDHIITDRGYSKAPGLLWAASRGAYVCVRLNSSSLALLGGKGRPLGLARRLSALTGPGEVGSWSAWLPNPAGDALPVRVCAVRKSEAATRLARKKLRRQASKKGHALREETLLFAAYVVLVSTFPQEGFSPEDVLEAYGLRWQVELVFKRFKQIAKLGHLPKPSRCTGCPRADASRPDSGSPDSPAATRR